MNAAVLNKFASESFRPDPIMAVSEWADNYRVLSKKASSEAGPWRTSRTPYLKEIMDTLSIFHPAQKVVFKKGSQVGGTESGNNWLGYVMDYAPGPFMLVLPTVDLARKVARQRITPLIDECPRLKEKVQKQKSRDSANTILMKDFPGGTLALAGANSAAGLKSMPARFVMLDELDEFPLDVEGQGDPVALVLARSRTFSRRKAFLVSTPTIDGISKIDDEFEISDKRFYYVPCPHCGHKQKLDFKNLQCENEDPKTTLYYCGDEHGGCGVGIEERYKTKMFADGEWRATAKSSVVGFHLSALYSPIGWFSWKEVVQAKIDADRDFEKHRKTEKLKAFYNTILGETYKEVGEAPEWKNLHGRRENYEIGTVPDKVNFLTMGCDVQKDRLHYEVVGWAEKHESFSITNEIILGDTALGREMPGSPWAVLDEVIAKEFTCELGGTMPIKMSAIDSGFNTQHVYNFCRKYQINRVVPIKGSDNLSVMIGHPRAVDVKTSGKTIRRGIKLFSIGVSLLKAELYSWLKFAAPIAGEPHPPGFCHFPQYGEDYFKELTAERLMIKKNRRGFSQTEWIKERERNEALDCRIYARAAASLVGLDRKKPGGTAPPQKNNVAKRNEPSQTESNEAGVNTESRASTRFIKKKKRESFWP